MNNRHKNAVLLLVSCFALGAILGAAITASIVKAQSTTVWMPMHCYAVISETEAEILLEEEVLDPEEAAEATKSQKLEPENLGRFKLTAYCTCSKCCGQWADGITATGTKATAGRTIAVDPNVIPLGSKVFINGYEYTAEDTGGAIKGNRIDILFPTHQDALNFGVQYAEVAIVKE